MREAGRTLLLFEKSHRNCPVRFAHFAQSDVILSKSKVRAHTACDDRSLCPASYLDRSLRLDRYLVFFADAL